MSALNAIGFGAFFLALIVGAVSGRRCGGSGRAVATCWAIGCVAIAFASLIGISALLGGHSIGRGNPTGDIFFLFFTVTAALPGMFGWTLGLIVGRGLAG